MNIKKIAVILILTLLSFNLNAISTPNYFSSNSKKQKTPDPIYNHTVTIPAGYVFSVTVSDRISRYNLVVPDRVYATLNSDFYYNNQLIAPEGSLLTGMVVKSSDATCQKDAQLLVKFTSITKPDGQIIPISALIKTEDKSGILYNDEEIKQNETTSVVVMQPITYTPR